MKVKLIYHTPNDVAYYSAKTCYSSTSGVEMVQNDIKTDEQKIKFISKVLDTGHFSVAEGLNYTFVIEGVSRSLMAQLTRHRQGIQFSVQSQRYVTYDVNNYDFVIPKEIEKNEKALKEYNKTMKYIFKSYQKLLDMGLPAEDARYVLPNATCTNITTTINLRELIHICGLRLCNRASLEIRQLMKEIVKEVIFVEPWLKPYLQPNCEQLGFCPEGNKSCGRRKTLPELLGQAYDQGRQDESEKY